MTAKRTITRGAAAIGYVMLLLMALPAGAADDYKLGPDSQRQEGVPKGAVSKHA